MTAQQMDATALRKVADALDALAQTTTTTGVAFCAYGRETIDVDGVTLNLARDDDGDTVRYVVDLTPG